jgi:hypothetical protein
VRDSVTNHSNPTAIRYLRDLELLEADFIVEKYAFGFQLHWRLSAPIELDL